jgi:uncharacterized membrane protein YgcG
VSRLRKGAAQTKVRLGGLRQALERMASPLTSCQAQRAKPSLRPKALLAGALALLALAFVGLDVGAQQEWVIRSFTARYSIQNDGTLDVVEDLDVDFGGSSHHGIVRDIPVRYPNETGRTRTIDVSVVSVEIGSDAVQFSTSQSGKNLRMKIGDPDRLVSGPQHYRITYRVRGALDAFADHDELYWNVTGNEWGTTIQQAAAFVEVPAPGIQRIACYEGAVGSKEPCRSSSTSSDASFSAATSLPPGSGLTIAVGLQKGLVAVQPAMFLEEKGVPEKLADFLGTSPLPIALSSALMAGLFGILGAAWWVTGRDRWYGDVYYLTGNQTQRIKPPLARETIVVEYAPPTIPAKNRPIRPAEMGLLIDERTDTLDIAGTIVDLAVRGYLRIDPASSEGIRGKPNYELVKLKEPDHALLRYERLLMKGLFGDRKAARLSDLEVHFNAQPARTELYDEAVKKNRFFGKDPSRVRQSYRLYATGTLIAGSAAVWLLGAIAGVGLIGVPVLLAAAALFLLAPAMPRRTALGREMYRRCLGFRLFMVTAEEERQQFLEERGAFEKFLPYAIVLGCTRKWAQVFRNLGIDQQMVEWYTSEVGVIPCLAGTLDHFVPALSTAGAGHNVGSIGGGFGAGGFGGFGGGGFSGGGGGGGGGGVW